MKRPISRPTITDDSGAGTDGTIWNADWVDDFCDRIDDAATMNYRARSSTTTALNTDDIIEATSGTWTLTLHAANDSTRGRNPLHVKNSGTGTITLVGDSGELIDGESSVELAPDDGVILISNGTAWGIY